MQEGIIKFRISSWQKTPALEKSLWIDIENSRKELYQLGLIGFDRLNKFGYGNISIRSSGNEFVITGSQTGHLRKLNGSHYSIIKNVDFETNSVVCEGPVRPSLEAISHGACYYNNSEVNSVIHIHSSILCERLYAKDYISTPENAECGSIELAKSISEIMKNSTIERSLLIVMKGHKDGIIIAGESIKDATNYLLDIYKSYILSG